METTQYFNSILWIELAIRDIHAYLTNGADEDVDDDSFIGVTVNSDNFAHDPAGISLRPIENFIYDDL